MKTLDLLCTEQQDAVTRVYENEGTYLIGQMGSGKTVVALTAISELLNAREIRRVLVVAPVRVAREVWGNEHTTWEHLQGLSVDVATGDETQRLNTIAGEAEVVVISVDALAWFFETYGEDHGFDMLVVDEVTKLKAGGVGFKALRKRVKDFAVRLVMTGTPVAESWNDLFYCVFACDGGALFGRNRQKFLTRYFYPEDYERRRWLIRPECVNEVTAMLDAIVVVLPDYTHELPPLTVKNHFVELSKYSMSYYKQFEENCLTETVTADSAAILSGKLQQIASGFVYTDEGNTEFIHKAKTEAAITLARGQTIFVYQFTEELKRLKNCFKKGRLYGISEKQDRITKALWDAGELQELFLHPKSAGHGLDFTAGHNIIFMSPIWSRDLTRQPIARIWRRNQTSDCTAWILCARGTIDEDIVERETGKGTHHELLMKRLNRSKTAWV